MPDRVPRPIPAEVSALIGRTAKRVYRQHVPEEARGRIERADLEQQGILGWLEAPDYDETQGVPLVFFARPYVHGRMVDFLRRALTPVPLPQARWADHRALEREKAAMRQAGERPAPAALAARLGWSTGKVARVEREAPRVDPFTEDGGGEDGGPSGNVVHGLFREEPAPERSLLRREMAASVQACLDRLDPTDRLVVLGRKLEDLKLKDLARLLGCTIERVRQREARALSRLRECLEARGWTGVEAGVNEGDLRHDVCYDGAVAAGERPDGER